MKNYFIGFSAVLCAAAVILSGCKNPSASTGTGGNTPSSGDTNAINTPTRIGDAAGWSLAALGDNHGAALNAGNGVFTWGKNDNGQLAEGSTSTAPNGVPTSRSTGWTKVSAGDEHALALKSGGTGGTNVQLLPGEQKLPAGWVLEA